MSNRQIVVVDFETTDLTPVHDHCGDRAVRGRDSRGEGGGVNDKVEARRLTARNDWQTVADWCGGELLVGVNDPEYAVVQVLRPDGDGYDNAHRGDWIIRDGDECTVVPGRHAEAILRAHREVA